MKKFIYLFAIIGLIISSFPAQKAEACSFAPGTPPPITRQEVLNAGGKISIVKPMDSGQVVAAMVQNYPVIMTAVAIPTQYVVLEGNGTSCTTAFDFSSNKYYVVVAPANDAFVIRHVERGNQFSTGYNTMSEAQSAYDSLVTRQNPNPPLPNPTGYTPVGYTLKYGMRGDDVRALQQAIKNYYVRESTNMVGGGNDYSSIIIDGIYGNKTVTLVKAFQDRTNLNPIDGVAGMMTQNKLSEVSQ